MDDTDRAVHVDRLEELARFREMVAGVGSSHVLLIQAEGGMGKTSLLHEFAEHSRERPCLYVDLKQKTLSVEGLLGQLCSLNRPAFANFFTRMEQLSGAGYVYINESEISTSQLNVRFETGPDTTEQREMRRQVLTQAFFSDLVAANRRGHIHVVLFDTYQDASSEMQDWLTATFLSNARAYRWLVVVVAGRQVPRLEFNWRDWCVQHRLRPLGLDHVDEYIRRSTRLQLSQETVATIYRGTQGKPNELRMFVKNLTGFSGIADA